MNATGRELLTDALRAARNAAQEIKANLEPELNDDLPSAALAFEFWIDGGSEDPAAELFDALQGWEKRRVRAHFIAVWESLQ